MTEVEKQEEVVAGHIQKMEIAEHQTDKLKEEYLAKYKEYYGLF